PPARGERRGQTGGPAVPRVLRWWLQAAGLRRVGLPGVLRQVRRHADADPPGGRRRSGPADGRARPQRDRLSEAAPYATRRRDHRWRGFAMVKRVRAEATWESYAQAARLCVRG